MFCRWPEYPGRMQHIYIKFFKKKEGKGRADGQACNTPRAPYEDYRVAGNRALHLPNISISASNGKPGRLNSSLGRWNLLLVNYSVFFSLPARLRGVPKANIIIFLQWRFPPFTQSREFQKFQHKIQSF